MVHSFDADMMLLINDDRFHGKDHESFLKVHPTDENGAIFFRVFRG